MARTLTEATLPGVAFRGINGSYTDPRGTVNQVTETLKMAYFNRLNPTRTRFTDSLHLLVSRIFQGNERRVGSSERKPGGLPNRSGAEAARERLAEAMYRVRFPEGEE